MEDKIKIAKEALETIRKVSDNISTHPDFITIWNIANNTLNYLNSENATTKSNPEEIEATAEYFRPER